MILPTISLHIHLHLISYWRHNFLNKKYFILPVIIFIISLVFIAAFGFYSIIQLENSLNDRSYDIGKHITEMENRISSIENEKNNLKVDDPERYEDESEFLEQEINMYKDEINDLLSIKEEFMQEKAENKNRQLDSIIIGGIIISTILFAIIFTINWIILSQKINDKNFGRKIFFIISIICIVLTVLFVLFERSNYALCFAVLYTGSAISFAIIRNRTSKD